MKLKKMGLNILSTHATTHEASPQVSADAPVKSLHGDKSVEELVNEMLLKTPEMSASTFVNLIKSKGLKFSKDDKVLKLASSAANGASLYRTLRSQGIKITESMKKSKPLRMAKLRCCLSGTSMPAQQRGVKESTWGFTKLARLMESSAVDDGIGPTRFHVLIIKEGMGNLGDAYYYTRSALESAVPVFEGKKCYANHPSSSEESTRPERDVRDIIGHFENVRLGEDEAGAAQLEADLVILPNKAYEWARSQAIHSVEYSKKFPDKDFVGLSINASGDAHPTNIDDFIKSGKIPESSLVKVEKAKEEGINIVRVVNKISEAVSCDLVTEAGAGGRIVSIIK